MTEEIKEDQEAVLPSDTIETAETVVEQDPLKTELEKVQRKGRTKTEKLLYTRNRINDQLKELGVEEDPNLEVDDEDQPVTLGMLKKMQAKDATKTALDLADDVSNPTERELVRYHLENTIRSTGNPQEDFRLAQGLVNQVKNQQILEETLRKPSAKTHGSNPGAPIKETKQEEFSNEELAFMRPPFNLTKEEIIKARTNK